MSSSVASVVAATRKPAQELSPLSLLLKLTGRESPLDVLGQQPPVADPELVDQVRCAFENDPPVPTAGQGVALQVINLIAQPQFQLPRLTQLVQQDAALSAGVVRAANSAAARGVEEIETLRDAIVRLGTREVGRVAGTVSARTLFQPEVRHNQAAFRAPLEACFIDAVVTARVAAEAALDLRGINSDRVFLGAMLHDIGRPVALRCFAALLQGRGSLPAPVVEAVVDHVHVELGVATHERLELPRTSTVIAANHHELELPQGPTFDELHLVRLVSALVRWYRSPVSILTGYREIDSSAAALGYDGHALRVLDTRVRERLAELAAP